MQGGPPRKGANHDQRIQCGARVLITDGDCAGKTGEIVSDWAGLRGITILVDGTGVRYVTGYDSVEVLTDTSSESTEGIPFDHLDDDDDLVILYGAPF